MKFHIDGTIPAQDGSTVWVFGSNLAGHHGAGAARIALQKFGARYYSGVGRVGMSYAIPTKNERLAVLTRPSIKQQITMFLLHARMHPKETFFVTRVGCGLAGYKDRDVAPMFDGAPDNCSFAEAWRFYLENANDDPRPADTRTNR